jgi:DnaJ family protein C protein 28
MSKAEEQIRRAMEDGKFDNLPGHGKPLDLNDNPHEDPEWRMAYRMLRDGGFTLPWIETRQEIENELKAARNDLARAWEWRKNILTDDYPQDVLEAEWGKAKQVFQERVEQLNKRILSYNLEVPNTRFQMSLLNFEDKLETITSPDTR